MDFGLLSVSLWKVDLWVLCMWNRTCGFGLGVPMHGKWTCGSHLHACPYVGIVWICGSYTCVPMWIVNLCSCMCVPIYVEWELVGPVCSYEECGLVGPIYEECGLVSPDVFL